MRIKLLICLFCLLFTNNLYSQWNNLNIDSTIQISSTHFVDANTGWIAGAFGKILKTTNGGVNWQDQSIANTNILLDVHFVSSSTGWAVGMFGVIVKTTNGGASWSNQLNFSLNDLLGIQFINSLVGYAVGRDGTILKSTSGGLLWSAQTSGTTSDLADLSFVNNNLGWAVGANGTILKTTNGGSSWISQTIVTTEQLTSVHFIDANIGWVVGTNGVIFITTNGGANWINQSSGFSGQLTGVHFISSTQGVAVGALGTILRTNNGGSAWLNESVDSLSQFTDVYVVNSNIAYAVGLAGRISKYDYVQPTVPNLLLPQNLASNVSLPVDFSWSQSNFANYYRLQVSTMQNFSVLSADTVSIGTNVSLSGLLSGADYYWRVRAYNNYDSSAWTNVRSFGTSSQLSSQIIGINAGWNMISLNVMPQNLSIASVLSSLSQEPILIKNATGNIYFPPFKSDLSTWNTNEAYKILMNNSDTLVVQGAAIQPQSTSVQFNRTGWHYIPYFRNSAMTVSNALSSIANNYQVVVNMQGEYYAPSAGGSLLMLYPGQGYKIYIINSGAQLVYPPN